MPARRRTAPRIDGWSDAGLARVAAWLGDEAGLTFPVNRRPGVENALREVMATLRAPDADALESLLRRSPVARETALAALTIGETYFFRDANQLALLSEVVLPALARRPGGRGRLRMWSAGCASGEEPYTLAMLVREAGWAAGADIVGTDVAPARLAAARRARYGRWSMRGVSAERLARWFHRQGQWWTVHPDVARDVRFRMLNLADPSWPSPESEVWGMDVVFCRNVLIYFDRETIADVARRLLGALAPDGWLFMGASDPLLTEFVPCEVVQTNAGLLYRPRGAPAGTGAIAVTAASTTAIAPPAIVPPAVAPPAVTPPAVAPRARADVPVAVPVSRERAREDARPDARAEAAGDGDPRAAYAAGRYAAAAEAARAGVEGGRADAATWTLLVRALANLGQLREAGAACAAALSLFPMEAELLVLHATLLLADDRPADAAAAARRALYLDRAAPMSHLLLGDALARTGNRAEAWRAFRAAERLLNELPADAAVPHADGERVASLLRVARYRAAAMGDAP